MDKTLFDELRQSLREAKAIAKGETQTSRRFAIQTPDVKAVREQTGLSQSDFARLIELLTPNAETIAAMKAARGTRDGWPR